MTKRKSKKKKEERSMQIENWDNNVQIPIHLLAL